MEAEVEHLATMHCIDMQLRVEVEASAGGACQRSVQATVRANERELALGRGKGGYKYTAVHSRTMNGFTLRYTCDEAGTRVIERLADLASSLGGAPDPRAREAMHGFEKAHPLHCALVGLLWTDGHFLVEGKGLTVRSLTLGVPRSERAACLQACCAARPHVRSPVPLCGPVCSILA